MNKIILQIENKGVIYEPILCNDLTWETERSGTPGKLKMTILNDKRIDFQEGNKVTLQVNDTPVFLGYIFYKERNKNQVITVLAYDQLRYLKNKDSHQFPAQTVSERVRFLTDKFKLITGEIEESGYVMPERTEDNKTLFDMILNGVDETYEATGSLFVLHDEYGKICLQKTENLIKNFLVDEKTAGDFHYSSSIDGETYNTIKLVYEDERKGVRKESVKENAQSIKDWGILQYFSNIDKDVNGEQKATVLLEKANKKKRTLTIQNILGDFQIKAGCSIYVDLILGDIDIKSIMLVEKAIHKINEQEHFMDLTVRGGLIGI